MMLPSGSVPRFSSRSPSVAWPRANRRRRRARTSLPATVLGHRPVAQGEAGEVAVDVAADFDAGQVDQRRQQRCRKLERRVVQFERAVGAELPFRRELGAAASVLERCRRRRRRQPCRTWLRRCRATHARRSPSPRRSSADCRALRPARSRSRSTRMWASWPSISPVSFAFGMRSSVAARRCRQLVGKIVEFEVARV